MVVGEEFILESIFAAFAGADSDGIKDFGDKYLAIAEFASLGSGDNCVNTIIELVILYDNIEFDFGDKIEGVCAAAKCAGLPLLATESAGF